MRSGLRLAVGAMPSEPASAAARSDRMSACRLVATIVSSVSGRSVMRMVMASTSILSQVTSGNSARDLGGDLVPHHHAVTLRVRLGDDGEQLARARAGEREGEAHDACDAGAREDRDLGCDLLGQAAMRRARPAPAYSPSEFSRTITQSSSGPRDVAQRARDAGQDAGRPDVGVLVERLADREPQPPERDVVRHVGRADRAEIDRIERASFSSPSSGIMRAVLAGSSPSPNRNARRRAEAAVALGAGRSTSSPAAITSVPMPSPGMAAMRWVFIPWSPRGCGRSPSFHTRVSSALHFLRGARGLRGSRGSSFPITISCTRRLVAARGLVASRNCSSPSPTAITRRDEMRNVVTSASRIAAARRWLSLRLSSRLPVASVWPTTSTRYSSRYGCQSASAMRPSVL